MESKLDEPQKEIQTIETENERLRENNQYLKQKNAQHEKMLEEMNREIKKKNRVDDQKEDTWE